MSTKIYNTCLNTNPNNHIMDIIQKYTENKVQARNDYLEDFTKKMSKDYIFNIVNNSTLKNPPKEETLFFNSLSFSNYDLERAFYGSEVTIMNYESVDKKIEGATLLQFFMPTNHPLKKILLEMPDSREFDYFNNVEMDVDDREEMLRKTVWGHVFKDVSIPSEAGQSLIVYDFITDLKENFEEVINKIIEKVIHEVQSVKITDLHESIYKKVKIQTIYANFKEKPSFEDSMRTYLDAERDARKDFESKVPLNVQEEESYQKIKEYCSKSMDSLSSKEMEKRLFNQFMTDMKKGLEQTIVNKVEEVKRMQEYRDYYKNKKNKP